MMTRPIIFPFDADKPYSASATNNEFKILTTIFDHAIKNSSSYDAAIRKGLGDGKSGEELFFELTLEDLTRAADLTRTKAVNANYERLGQASVSLDDIRHFRQLDSKAPGHPEYHWVSGVETTTGPLGQGVATSVGMGIAQKWLVNRYNRPGFEIFDYNIYAVAEMAA